MSSYVNEICEHFFERINDNNFDLLLLHTFLKGKVFVQSKIAFIKIKIDNSKPWSKQLK